MSNNSFFDTSSDDESLASFYHYERGSTMDFSSDTFGNLSDSASQSSVMLVASSSSSSSSCPSFDTNESDSESDMEFGEPEPLHVSFGSEEYEEQEQHHASFGSDDAESDYSLPSDMPALVASSSLLVEEPTLDDSFLSHIPSFNSTIEEYQPDDAMQNPESPLDTSIEAFVQTPKCPICFGNILKRQPHSLPCGHVFCKFCINKLIVQDSKICAMCQKAFKNDTSDIRRIYFN